MSNVKQRIFFLTAAAILCGAAQPAFAQLKSAPGDWPAWRRFREMRGRTSHTYDAQAALAVVSAIPEFLEEAEHLCGELERRLN